MGEPQHQQHATQRSPLSNGADKWSAACEVFAHSCVGASYLQVTLVQVQDFIRPLEFRSWLGQASWQAVVCCTAMHGACVRQAQQACSRRPLVCLAKDRRGIPQRKVEPVTFTRSDSMDLTKSLQRCSTWQQVQVLYQRHRDLPLHPINRAAFFTRLQYVLQQQATAAKQARHNMSHGGGAGSSAEQRRRSAVATDPQPLLRTLPATERQAVEQICGTWALDIGNAIDGIGGKELSIIAK